MLTEITTFSGIKKLRKICGVKLFNFTLTVKVLQALPAWA